MVQLISRKTIKPEQCAFCFGIPTNKNDFKKDQVDPKKGYAKRFNNVYSKYEFQILSHLKIVEPKIEESGASIIYSLTLKKFGDLLRNSKFEVIILFSHWKKNAVEFFDGYASTDRIIDQIPVDFSGFIDLTVCHPDELIVNLHKKREHCMTKSALNKVTPFIWLYFYELLFRHLKENNLSYLKALEDTIEAFYFIDNEGRENESASIHL